MGIQNVAAIFCIPLIPPLLGYKIWQPHSVSPKRSKGGYRIWQAYIIWRYTGVAPDNVSPTKCVGIQNMARGLPQSVWGYKIWQGGCHILYPLPYSVPPLPYFVPP